MVFSIRTVDCLARAAAERELAAAARLENVREQYLRSARSWEDLSKQGWHPPSSQDGVENAVPR